MKRFYLLSVLMAMLAICANAQLEVNDDGKVAISATNSNFIPRLSVGDNCVFTTGTECNFGIAAAPLIQNNKKNIAVEGYVNSSQSFTSDTNVGVLGLTKLNPNHGRNFGVVGATDFNVYPTCVGGAGVYATNHGYYLYNPPTIQGTYALGQDGCQYINYTELVPILIRGIQELKSEVNELKAKCAGVEKADIDELESEGIQISLK